VTSHLGKRKHNPQIRGVGKLGFVYFVRRKQVSFHRCVQYIKYSYVKTEEGFIYIYVKYKWILIALVVINI
jgi:hypothetical protein